MPQWNRDPAKLRRRYPDERWTGRCGRENAEALRRADHHVVRIAGRKALLLTYAWDAIPTDDWPDQLTFEVSFTYPEGHPSAPDAVQRIVESLAFEATALRPADDSQS